MKFKNKSLPKVILLLAVFTITLPFLSASQSIFAQSGNTISGTIFGVDRRPLDSINVELQDAYYRTFMRVRTNGSGRYYFSGIGSGRFTIVVLPFGTEYEEQRQEVEIQNFNFNGRPSGFANEQKDFYLKIRKNAQPINNEVVFAQDIPADAKKLYEEGIKALDDKKQKEGFDKLKAALEIFPKYYAALEKLGREYLSLGYYEAAQILLAIAVDVNPRGYRSWYGLAYAQYAQKDYKNAQTSVDKAVEILPTSYDALLLSGVILRQFGKFEDSEKQFIKSRDAYDSADVHFQLGLLYANNMKRYKDAVKEFKAYLKLSPNAKNAEDVKKTIKDLEVKPDNT
ncbi:MAG TPA: tetratricopeptide repeat protein [Pyrinomonadaceae bacterium]|nr:tetratricopeptide repeat protein [Pyrinomonadaceae bacterium]